MRAASPDRQVTLGASPTFHMPDFSDLADGVVASPEHEARLAEIIEVELSDDQLAWELDSEGGWHRVPSRLGINAQERFMALAHERAREQDARRLA